MKPGDDEARRSFWTCQMDAGYAFMKEMLPYPVEECGEPLVSLPEASEAAGVEVQFSQTKIAGQFDRIFRLRQGLIDSFLAIAAAMNSRGWTLKVEDAVRTCRMQKTLALQDNILSVILQRVIWENKGKIPDPEMMFKRLTALIATCPKIGTHIAGSAMDISVLHTDDLSEVDRGAPYLEMSELTPMNSPFVSDEAQRNRAEITAIMLRHGFVAYPYEFWHYNRGDAYAERLSGSERPGIYGPVDFDPATGATTPVPNPTEPFHSMEDIRRYIESGLQQLNTTQ